MFILQAGILIALLGMAYQDFRHRGIYWWMFPIVSILLTWNTLQLVSLETMVNAIIKSSLFLAIQLIILTAYLSIKQKQLVNILTGSFGLGDLLFLVALTMGLSFLNYVAFYIISLLLVIIFSLFTIKRSNMEGYKIPLAGYQAIFFAILLMMEWLVPTRLLYADDFLTHLLVYGN